MVAGIVNIEDACKISVINEQHAMLNEGKVDLDDHQKIHA